MKFMRKVESLTRRRGQCARLVCQHTQQSVTGCITNSQPVRLRRRVETEQNNQNQIKGNVHSSICLRDGKGIRLFQLLAKGETLTSHQVTSVSTTQCELPPHTWGYFIFKPDAKV